MEFLDKKKRILLIGIAQKGPAGMSYNEIYSTFTYFMSKESIQKTLEELYFSGSINIIRDGDEIRYIASNKARNSLIALELQKFRIMKFLEKVKEKSAEISKMQDKNVQLQELEKLGKEALEIISLGLLSLFKEFPELTVPEYLEMIEVLYNEFLSKMSSIISPKLTDEETKQFLTLIGKYRGEKDLEVIKKLMDSLKG